LAGCLRADRQAAELDVTFARSGPAWSAARPAAEPSAQALKQDASIVRGPRMPQR
jgi:hypothetical protein